MRKELSNVAYAYEELLKEAGYVPSIQPPLMGAKEALAAPDPLLEVLEQLVKRGEKLKDMYPEQTGMWHAMTREAREAIAEAEATAKIYT